MGKVTRLSNRDLKKAIKRNDLEEALEGTAGWLRNNLENVLIGGVVIIVLAILVPYYFGNKSGDSAKAAQALREAHQLMQRAVSAGDPDLDQVRQAKGRFQAVVTSDAGSDAGIEAQLLVAQADLKLGDFDQAITGFSAFVAENGSHSLAAIARSGLGYAHEAKGSYDTAAGHFLSVKDDPKAANRGLAYLDAARCLKLAGKADQASKLLVEAGKNAKDLGLPTSMVARLAVN